MWMVQRPHPTLSPFIVVVALVVAIHVLHANTPPPPHTHTPPSQLIILVNLFVHTLTHMCVCLVSLQDALRSLEMPRFTRRYPALLETLMKQMLELVKV
jgi:hypothetical protein